MKYISGSHISRVSIVSSTTLAAIGLAFIFWKLYNRRTRPGHPTQEESNHSITIDEWENAADTPIRESLPNAQQLYRYGLEHLNISIDYWQRALSIIDISLQNIPSSENRNDLIQSDELLNQNRLNELKQKIEFLLNKIDIQSNRTELELIVKQEQERRSVNITDDSQIVPNRIQDLQTALSVQSDINLFNDRRSLRSIRSTDSFQSCPDDAEWLDASDLIFDPSSPYYSLPSFYVYGLRLAEKNQVPYKKLRTRLLHCSSDTDYLAKLSCIRNACDELLGNDEKKTFLKRIAKAICEKLLERAMKDKTRFIGAFDHMNALLADEKKWSMINEELAAAGIKSPTVYNVGIDFMLLEGFEILDSPPSAMCAILQNRWFSEAFREQALNKAVSCAVKVRRATAKYQDGFLTTFLTLIEDMSPIFAWGILGPNSVVKPMCIFLKDTVLDFARSLYDLNRTDYSSLTSLTADIDRQLNNLLSTITKEMNVDPDILSDQHLTSSTVHFT